MYSIFQAALKPLKNVPLSKNMSFYSTPNRGVKVLAGRYQKPVEHNIPGVTPDSTTVIQSDLSGFHNIAAVQTCSTEPQCGKRLCDSVDEDKCPYKNTNKNPALVTEMAGGLTHKVPSHLQGVALDPYDANGTNKKGGQSMVIEQAILPLDIQKFKIDEKMTDFVQQPSIATEIVKNMPPNSVVYLKNTSYCNTPYDENF
jgi:hypothetical protein